jgi:hypothetical protein
MPTSTYDLIASNVLGTAVTSVSFSSIPATYRDLILVMEIDLTSTFDGFRTLSLRFNGDTGSNYNRVLMEGNGSSAISGSATNSTSLALAGNNSRTDDATNPTFIIQLMDYSATDKHKTILSRKNQAARTTVAQASRWASTSAINEITVDVTQPDPTNFAVGSTFYLYGIVS